MSQKDDSEDDIWEYKPLRKKRKKQQSTSQSAHQTHKCSLVKSSPMGVKSTDPNRSISKGHSPSTSVNTPGSINNGHSPPTSGNNPGSINKGDVPVFHPGRSVQEDETTPAGDGATETSDFCPICQMPFSTLVAQSQTGHVTECLDTPRDHILGTCCYPSGWVIYSKWMVLIHGKQIVGVHVTGVVFACYCLVIVWLLQWDTF